MLFSSLASVGGNFLGGWWGRLTKWDIELTACILIVLKIFHSHYEKPCTIASQSPVPIFQDEISQRVYKGFTYVDKFDEGVARVSNISCKYRTLYHLMILRLLREIMLLWTVSLRLGNCFYPTLFYTYTTVRYRIAAEYTNHLQETSLHISKECFVSFRVGLGMPKHSPYKSRVDLMIQRLIEGGFVDQWMMEMNSQAQKNKKMVNLPLFFLNTLSFIRGLVILQRRRKSKTLLGTWPWHCLIYRELLFFSWQEYLQALQFSVWNY